MLASYEDQEIPLRFANNGKNDDTTRILRIEHSVRIIGDKRFRPRLTSNKSRVFEIVSSGSGGSGGGDVHTTTVIFEDITFTSSPNKQKCTLPSRGFIHVANSNLAIKNCVIARFCAAVTLSLTDEHNPITYNLTIELTRFEKNMFAVSGNHLEKASVSITRTAFIGTTSKDFTSYAVSLQTEDYLEFIFEGCDVQEFHQGVSLTFRNGVHHVLVNSSRFSRIEGQVIIAKFSKNVDEEGSTFRIHNSTFVNNRGLFSSALHLLVPEIDRTRIFATVTDSNFTNNEGRALFGTVYVNGIHLKIVNSFFGHNIAGKVHSDIQGFGGAIYIETDTTVEVVDTRFRNNTCTGFGGSVFSRGSFNCKNCTFHGIAPKNYMKPLLGNILYATSNLTLSDTSWVAEAFDDSKSRPLIWHPGSPTVEDWKISVLGTFQVSCPDGHNISHSGIVRNNFDFTKRLTLYCKPCPRNEYSLASGFLKVVQNDGIVSKKTEKKAICYPCKYGGICSHGSIRPQSNYYGYRKGSNESNEVGFMPCPSGYCCKGVECQKFDSCSTNRSGFLCGQCKPGLSENLINANCIPPARCNDIWIVPMYLLAGAIYIISFMYLDSIGYFIKSQLIWWEQHITIRKDLDEYETLKPNGASERLNSSSDEFDDRDNTDNVAGLFTPVLDVFASLETKKGPDLFTDFVSLSFYFFQMFLLIRMRESIVLEHLATRARVIYSSWFTMSIEMNNNPLVLCPVPHLTAISKLLLIKSFSFYVLGLLLLFHGFVYLIQLKEEWNNQTIIHFSVRLKVATIRIIQLAYATLTTTAMTLVSCVNINEQFVLLIDGSVKCYVWWQWNIFVIVIGWVIPFPITLAQSLVDLKKNTITYHQFILAWVFPLPYLCWSCYSWCKRRYERRRGRARTITVVNEQLDHDTFEEMNTGSEMDQSVKVILYRMECPYKGKSNHLTADEYAKYRDMKIPEPAFWSGVLIGRRLILILVFSFVQAPVLRLYIALIFCIVYLVHHMYYQPYLNTPSNIVEVVSSSILILFCSMNLFFAYSYVSDVAPEAADQTLTILFRWFEAIVLVALPTLCVLGLACLVLTRMCVLVGHCFQYLWCSYPQRIDR